MVRRETLLDVASFLDSDSSRSVKGIGREDLRTIATAIIAGCYEDLGQEPRTLDGEGVRSLLTRCLPGRFKRRDPLAAHFEEVMYAFLDHLEASEVVSHAFEMRLGVADALPQFLDTVRTGANEQRATGGKAKPVVHRTEKLGRNDPCSCGSGKKYKKCHGKGA